MTKKLLLIAAVALATRATAGGLMTNTNYHVAFDRMMARGASTEIDAAYSNPAGLVWGYDGFQLSIDFQKPWQNRDIECNGVKYPGKASAPIVPALFASYKKDRLAVSSMIGIVGSGGYVKFNNGIPMFSVPVAATLAGNSITQGYALDTKMEGKQYIYGGQVNVAYRLSDNFSASVGMRANYYDGFTRGHLTAVAGNQLAGMLQQVGMLPTGKADLVNMQLDCNQTGWGFAPIVGFNTHIGPLTVAARYEFRTKLKTKNDTKQLIIGSMGQDVDIKAMAEKIGTQQTVAALSQTTLSAMAPKIGEYLPDEETRYDMPALLSLAVGYEFTDKLRVTAEYHFFDDKNAKMSGDRQKELKSGTNEYLIGAEYDINDRFTVSLGGQRTDYGLSDGYQQNTSFACDSYSIGLGGAWNVTDKIRLNAGYFCTIYSDYTKTAAYGQETFSRTNNVVGVGVDFKF